MSKLSQKNSNIIVTVRFHATFPLICQTLIHTKEGSIMCILLVTSIFTLYWQCIIYIVLLFMFLCAYLFWHCFSYNIFVIIILLCKSVRPSNSKSMCIQFHWIMISGFVYLLFLVFLSVCGLLVNFLLAQLNWFLGPCVRDCCGSKSKSVTHLTT